MADKLESTKREIIDPRVGPFSSAKEIEAEIKVLERKKKPHSVERQSTIAEMKRWLVQQKQLADLVGES